MPTLPELPSFKDQPERYRTGLPYGFFLEAPVGKAINDIVASQTDYIELNLNPQQVQCREPFATAVTVTQGGGKYIESHGMILKQFQISGTTGYLPQRWDSSATPTQAQISQAVAEAQKGSVDAQTTLRDITNMLRSGYKAFYELRQLFRRYGYMKRLGESARIHYMDFNGDEFWRIEPTEFSMTQDAKRPFLYNYQIAFQGIEPSEMANKVPRKGATASVPRLAQLGVPDDPDDTVFYGNGNPGDVDDPDYVEGPTYTPLRVLTDSGVRVGANTARMLDRMRQQHTNGLNFLKNISGAVQRKFQGLLNDVASVLQFFEDTGSSIRSLFLDTPLTLLKMLDDSVEGLFILIDRYSPDNVKEEINEYLCEMRWLVSHMAAHFLSTSTDPGNVVLTENSKFIEPRGTQGSRDDLLQEADGSTGSLPANPYFGRAGLNLLGGLRSAAAVKTLRTERVLRGENIYTCSQRLLGSPHLYYQLVLFNNLKAPYIIARYSEADKPPGTLAWGDAIRVPEYSQNVTPSAVAGEPVQCSPVQCVGEISNGGTSTELIDETRDWREDELVGFTVLLTSGSGAGDERVVVGNTATTVAISRAWTITPAVGDEYQIQLQTFDLRAAPRPEEITYGRDVLCKRLSNGKFDALIAALGDLATVTGIENLHQALTLLLHTEQGSNMFHRAYGVGLPVGRPAHASILSLHTFFLRQSLYGDPRVAEVIRPQLSFAGGALRIEVQVKPVKTNTAQTLRVLR